MSNYKISKFRGKWIIEDKKSRLSYKNRLFKYKFIAKIYKFFLDILNK